MQVEIKVPSVGESVTEAVLAEWFKKDGDPVKKDEPLFVIETDKITLEVVAEATGVLSIKVAEGGTVPVGAVVGTIDTEATVDEAEEKEEIAAVKEAAQKEPRAQAKKPIKAGAEKPTPPKKFKEKLAEKPKEKEPAADVPSPEKKPSLLGPSVRRLIAAQHLDVDKITGTGPGGRITKGDVWLYLEKTAAAEPEKQPQPADSKTVPAAKEAVGDKEAVSRKTMSPIRQRIAARLLDAKQNTAMLTTFNEIDMEKVMALRKQYQETFNRKYGVNLGIMSFFIKAGIEALKEFAQINAFIDGRDIIEHHYYHIGVAVGSERGLVVPVIRHADKLSFAELELAIVDFVEKINTNRLELSDLEGGTFTISNGGVYGSLLSTPILNMPQSGILGMHKIEKRPVVIDEKVVIRPMMYVALSYDHRIVDGREAVTFLKRIKECIENPERIMMEI
jgi:2-oxoglutarate dehydrogenase E2 component (dihydrolipoamide succinyltransferase)